MCSRMFQQRSAVGPIRWTFPGQRELARSCSTSRRNQPNHCSHSRNHFCRSPDRTRRNRRRSRSSNCADGANPAGSRPSIHQTGKLRQNWRSKGPRPRRPPRSKSCVEKAFSILTLFCEFEVMIADRRSNITYGFSKTVGLSCGMCKSGNRISPDLNQFQNHLKQPDASAFRLIRLAVGR
jgi:hypothetical protein